MAFNAEMFNRELDDMNLEAVNQRLANLDIEVRTMTEVEKVEEATEQKRMLIARQKELEALQTRKQAALDLQSGRAVGRVIETRGLPMGVTNGTAIERGFGKQLLEKRAAIASSSLLIPQMLQDNIEKKFNTVSGILDLVKFVNVGRGNKWVVPYSNTVATGGITAEGADATETTPTFSTVEINGYKVTGYTQYNEECEKLPSADYETFIMDEIKNAVNRKIIQQIVSGTGSTNSQFNGLYSTSVVAATGDITDTAIDADTLDNIIYGHNTSAEEVEGNMVLFLNKKDLGAFSKIRSTDGQRVYDIKFNETGMAGTINGTKFCICNGLNALSDSTVTANSYTMVYLDPNQYILPVFSDFELKKTDVIDFIKGKITVKGSMILGGSPANPYCLTRVKKVAA